MSDKEWLVKKFGTLPGDTLDRLVSVKNIFNYSNDDIYVQWEAFVVTTADGDLDVTTENIDRFQQHLQNTLTAQKLTPAKKINVVGKRKPVMRTDFSSSPGGVMLPSTPVLKKRKPDPSSPVSSPSRFDTANNTFNSSPQKSMPNSNSILECLNPEIVLHDSDSTVQLSANFDATKYKFRTMAMKLLESADVLDDQIDSFSLQFLDLYKDKDLQLGNPCMSSQFDIVCCGRIVPDSPLYDSTMAQNLNDKSLFLETSRLGGIGQRIPLDLLNLSEYSFFPGQIVGLRGRNPTGRTFVAHEVLSLPELGTPASSLPELEELSRGNGVKVIVASGPFTNQHTLDFLRLESLVEHINNKVQPQVAILCGPFLDITNKSVESGEIEILGQQQNQQPKNLDDVFRALVTPLLKKIDPKIQVVLLPSLKDAVSKHTSYPQSSLDRKRLGLPKNFKCFPNPCSFSVNEVVFGVSNADIFKDLKDVYKNAGGEKKVFSNRFERIANHIFEQKRYYPVFPGAVKRAILPKEESDIKTTMLDGAMAEELVETDVGGSSLEVPYMGLAELGDSLPDVLIIPSELKYFAKVIKNVVVVNPGHYIRANKDASKEEGSYVVMSIAAPDSTAGNNVDAVEGTDLYYHNVYKRARVDICKS